MNNNCPQCHNPMLQATSGWMCPSCGHSIHFAYPPKNQNPPADFSDHQTSPISPASNPIDQSPQTEVDALPRPQIINHHTSSQYRKRLQALTDRLEETELSPPDDPRLMPADDLPQTLPEEATKSPAIMNSEDEHTTTEPPYKPTPMSASVLDLRQADQEKSSPKLDTPNASPRQTTTLDRQTAIRQAEALLSSSKASSPLNDSARFRVVLYATGSAILAGIAIWMVYAIMRPATLINTNTPKPSSSSSPQTSSSPATESQTRDKRRKSDLTNLAAGLAAYKKATGSYPVGEDIMVLNTLTEADPPYIKSIPTDPLSSETTVIKYGYTSNGTSFSLTAALENKQDPDAKNGLYILK